MKAVPALHRTWSVAPPRLTRSRRRSGAGPHTLRHATGIPGRPRRAPRRAAIILATAALALLAAACGASPRGHVAHDGSSAGQNSSASGASSGAGSVHAQAVAYADCMRSHGVPTWPDPDSSGVFAKSATTPQRLGQTSSKIAAAQADCKQLQPNYASSGPTPAQVQQVRAQALRFSKCMRSHGIAAFPDPDSRGGIRIPHSIENSPQYDAALNACKPFPPPPYPAG